MCSKMAIGTMKTRGKPLDFMSTPPFVDLRNLENIVPKGPQIPNSLLPLEFGESTSFCACGLLVA